MLYDYPEYYELAFSFRNYEAEARFLKTCIDRFARVPVKRVLEIGCGTAPHAGELVNFGYDYVGLDINPHMLEYAAAKWRDLGPSLSLVIGDMNNFHLDSRVDFAFVMLGSLYASDHNQIAAHFDSVARALRPGGLYFLDWCVQFSDPMTRRMHNTVVSERRGVKIESTFTTTLVDPADQLYEEVWRVDVEDRGHRQSFKMVERNRAIYPQEFLLFIKHRPDFEFVGWWCDWDLNRPIGQNGTDTTRPSIIIRRR